jgi:hypothetical protein
MKKYYFLFIFLLSSVGVFSQNSLRLYYNNELLANDDSMYFFMDSSQYTAQYVQLAVENISNNNLNVKVKKTEISVIPGTENSFCCVMCYDASVLVSTKYITIPAHSINNTDFYGEYYPKGHLGTSIIRYTFFDMNNAVDSASMIAVYVATPVGIEELVENNNILLYPNPTSGIANLNLDLKNDLTLEIFNSLGARVLQENILNNSIDLSLLPEGIYYYRIKENNRIKTNNILVIQK